jgi:hypothetical protein
MMRGSIATLLLVAILVYALQVLIVQPLSPEWVITLTLSVFSLVVLVLLVIVRMADALRDGWNYLNGSYDIAAGTEWATQNDNNREWNPFDWLKGVHILFGRSLCWTQFPWVLYVEYTSSIGILYTALGLKACGSL